MDEAAVSATRGVSGISTATVGCCGRYERSCSDFWSGEVSRVELGACKRGSNWGKLPCPCPNPASTASLPLTMTASGPRLPGRSRRSRCSGLLRRIWGSPTGCYCLAATAMSFLKLLGRRDVDPREPQGTASIAPGSLRLRQLHSGNMDLLLRRGGNRDFHLWRAIRNRLITLLVSESAEAFNISRVPDRGVRSPPPYRQLLPCLIPWNEFRMQPIASERYLRYLDGG